MIVVKVLWATTSSYAAADSYVPTTKAIFPVLEIYDYAGNDLIVVHVLKGQTCINSQFYTTDDPIQEALNLFGENAKAEVEKYLSIVQSSGCRELLDKYEQVYY